jgi:hypothetical protein
LAPCDVRPNEAIVNAVLVALVVLTCTFGGALVGMWLRAALPQHHLDGESRDVVKLATGLIATMAALVLGLVVASAKSGFDALDEALKHSAAKVLMLDRALARYGPETANVRQSIRGVVVARLEMTWPEDAARIPRLDNSQATGTLETIADEILALAPQTEAQRRLQAQALAIGNELMETRWLVLGVAGSSVGLPFLSIVVCWLTLIFMSFGLFAPRHATAIVALGLAALSVAAAVFLILEMDHPLDGLMKISSDPLHYALSHLGK